MKTTVNRDGSITTEVDDVQPSGVEAAEAKVVEPDEKPAAKTRSRSEHK